MTDTTLLINEAEKENARALAQSFVKKDVKSRAYINALGAEVCMQYLHDNDIIADKVCNIHSIRKILEEFDISDIMLSNIHIDVRVVYDDNKIFIPKSHFDYNLTPDIYVVMQISGDHSQMEFLGFFEPKMLNRNNTNGEYFFIEKEKLSSPVDLKSFIENYSGSTSSDMSAQDMEHAEYLIIAMADNNVSDDDKKRLISYLRNSVELRDKFIEFENFEMLAYHAVNSIDIDVNPNNSSEMEIEDMAVGGLDSDTVQDIELSNALNTEESVASNELSEDAEFFSDSKDMNTENFGNNDAEILTDDIFNIVDGNSDNIQDNSETGVGDTLKGAAIIGSEVAGAVMTSAALSGAAAGAEIAKDIAITSSEVVDGVTELADSISDSFTGHEHIGEDSSIENISPKHENDIQSSLDTLFNDDDVSAESDKIAVQDVQSADAIEHSAVEDINNDLTQGDINGADLFEEPKNTENTTAPESVGLEDVNNAEVFAQYDSNGTEFFEEPQNVVDNSEIPLESDFSELLGGIDDVTSDKYSDELVFEYNDGLDEDSSELLCGGATEGFSDVSTFGKPAISPVDHTPITEATELVSLENIKLGNIPPLGGHKNVMNSVDMPKLDVDVNTNMENSVDLPVDAGDDYSENVVSSVDADEIFADGNTAEGMHDESSENNAAGELTSDDFVQEMPEEIEKTEVVDELTSDDFVQEMPEEIAQREVVNEPTSDDFVQEMPEDINKVEVVDELTSDDFVQEMPEDIKKTEVVDELTSDDFVQDMPEELPKGEKSSTDQKELQTQAENIVDGADTLPEVELFEDIPPIPGLEEVNTVTTAAAVSGAVAENSAVDIGEVSENAEISDLDLSGSESGGVDEIYNQISEDDSDISVLYDESNPQKLSEESFDEENLPADYDFRPKRKFGLMPMCAILALAILAACVVGFFLKSKDSIDETFVQSSPDNLINPEDDNSGILASDELLETNIPNDLDDVSPSAPAPSLTKNDNKVTAAETAPVVNKNEKQEIVKNAKSEIKKQQEQLVTPAPKTPLNASKTVTLKKLSWEVPDYLSYSDNIKKYLQSAGKSIQLTLSSDLLLTNEYIYSNRVKVDITLSKDGDIKGSPKITSSSGSQQVDKIVLQTVKDTLNVVKPPRGEVPTPEYKLGLIIYL